LHISNVHVAIEINRETRNCKHHQAAAKPAACTNSLGLSEPNLARNSRPAVYADRLSSDRCILSPMWGKNAKFWPNFLILGEGSSCTHPPLPIQAKFGRRQ